jgi:eukaryotic-like serine/threonine-protein kinase
MSICHKAIPSELPDCLLRKSRLNYVTRVKIPTLMLNGKFDIRRPEKTIQPMYDLLGTVAAGKQLKFYETDHTPPRNELIKETLAWLDRYLGPVQ